MRIGGGSTCYSFLECSGAERERHDYPAHAVEARARARIMTVSP